MPCKEHKYKWLYSMNSCACVGVPRTEAGRCAGGIGTLVVAQHFIATFPMAPMAGGSELRSEGNTGCFTNSVGCYLVPVD